MSHFTDFKREVIIWNSKFPVDRWYRDKHKIPYNSSKHRESSFIDQIFELIEDRLWDKVSEKTYYDPSRIFKETSSSTEEVDTWIKDVDDDLSKYDDK